MRKPNNYENTQAQGEFTPVELGGHTLVIKQVEERMSKINKPIAGADGLMMCATSHKINSSRQLRM